MANYQFLGDMVRTGGWVWDTAWLLGYQTMSAEMYLRGDITRAEFTADHACYVIARDMFFRLLDEIPDVPRAMMALLEALEVSVPLPSQAGGAPSAVAG